MERESFEDEGIAARMNASFVCVKVDREERPDLDEIYMAATQAMNAGQGGWPMTVFLTPDQQPFFAGTYFPPTDSYGRPGFGTLLARISRLWSEKRDELVAQAAQLSHHLHLQIRPAPPHAVAVDQLGVAVRQLARDFDAAHGGFGGAPKFPPSTALSLLLRHHRRTGDANSLHMAHRTLTAMARGGMYDQVGGGFCRYSVDDRWLVPHFEKMLYDNALLARAYLAGWQVTKDPFLRRVAAEILDYVLREMTAAEGAFHSATDADSEGEEGRFYVWTPAQVEAVLDPAEARRFCAYYQVTSSGNWEGRSILNTPRTVEQVASTLGISPQELQASLEAARPKIHAARLRRVPPGLDDKVLTAWNGLMIGSLAEGHRVLRDRRFLEAAERAAGFLRGALVRQDGGLYRTHRAGRSHLHAYLEDYAYLAEGLLDLYEAGGSAVHFAEALRLAERMLRDFADPAGGGFYSTAADHEELLLRHREGTDGATPSANAVAASVLGRLAFHLGREEFRAASETAIAAYGTLIERHPRAFARSIEVVDFLADGPVELAFVGGAGDERHEALWREAAAVYLPNRLVAHGLGSEEAGPGADSNVPPLMRGKGLVSGEPALYVCRDFSCQSPITRPAEVAAALVRAPVAAAESNRLGDLHSVSA